MSYRRRRQLWLPSYLLRDEFLTDRAAGSVNGTLAEPGPGTRTVVDTESKVSISGGKLVISGGKAVPAWGDPVVILNSEVRVPGKMVVAGLKILSAAGYAMCGWNNVGGGFDCGGFLYFEGTGTMGIFDGYAIRVGSYSINDTFKVAVLARATGSFVLLKGGNYTKWTLLPASRFLNSTPLYPDISNHSSSLEIYYLQVPTFLWLPSPHLSDGFTGTFGVTDGLGHQEGVNGGLGVGGSGQVWKHGGTWATAGGLATNTPVLGAEEVSDVPFNNAPNWSCAAGWAISGAKAVKSVSGGNAGCYDLGGVTGLVGRWYKVAGDVVITAGGIFLCAGTTGTWFGTSGAKVGTVRGTVAQVPFLYAGAADVGSVDNFSVKRIPNSSLFASMKLVTGDVLAELTIHAAHPNAHVGMVLNADRSFAAKCAVARTTGNDISLKEVTAAITASDTLTIAGTTYTISSVGSYDAVAMTQTITLGSDPGVVALDALIGVDYISWNGVIVNYVNAASIYLDEVVNGVYLNRSATATAFVTDAPLVVQKRGSEYRIYYQNVDVTILVASTSAVDPAAMAGKYHGIFSTYEGNTVGSMSVHATGSDDEYAFVEGFTG